MKYYLSILALLLACRAQAEIGFRNWDDPDAAPWKESGYALPAFPKDENLLEFYVSATANAQYFIDQSSISTGGNDNVVRYVMVIKTAGGATNISYEGIRCDQTQLRIYATGRSDGTWVEARNSNWRPLKNQSLNRHQGALARNYFCPNYIPIFTADEGRNALRRGAHPDAPSQF